MSSAALFDSYADRYESWYIRNRLTALNELLAIRSLGLPRPIAEIGVGTGWLAALIPAQIGVDPATRMVSRAGERGIDAVVAVGEALPIRRGSLGSALIVVTLCFVDDPHALMREAGNAARVVAACIVPRGSPWGLTYAEMGAAGHPLYSVARFYSVGEVAGIAESVGLVVDEVVATLSYSPGDAPRLEPPRRVSIAEAERFGFACVRARRRA